MSIESRDGVLQVELALLPEADPIRGWVRTADGAETAFSGWLELMQLIDGARSAGRARTEDQGE
jgi:hypothetical protein